jgi:hypothetical protein
VPNWHWLEDRSKKEKVASSSVRFDLDIDQKRWRLRADTAQNSLSACRETSLAPHWPVDCTERLPEDVSHFVIFSLYTCWMWQCKDARSYVREHRLTSFKWIDDCQALIIALWFTKISPKNFESPHNLQPDFINYSVELTHPTKKGATLQSRKTMIHSKSEAHLTDSITEHQAIFAGRQWYNYLNDIHRAKDKTGSIFFRSPQKS